MKAMKRLKKWWLPVVLILALTACGKDDPISEDGENITPQNNLKTEKEEKIEDNSAENLLADSYWTAYSIDEMGNERALPDEELWIDLIFRKDGTAQFRYVLQDVFFANPDFLDMTWSVDENQKLGLYLESYEESVLDANVEDDRITMTFFGDTIYFERAEMPQEVGKLYCPAQLSGVWLMESSETEGDLWEVQPGYSESVIFRVMDSENGSKMVSLGETRDHEGDYKEGYEETDVTVLDEPLYTYCENQEWSVLVGAYSEKNENGYPLEVETYVTLLDENTMLRQLYYSFDGGPGVSYQTFKRVTFADDVWDYEEEDLEGGDYECIAYIDAEGMEHAYPPEMEQFYVHLDVNSDCTISWWDEELGDQRWFRGSWILGKGGVVNLISDDYCLETEFTETCWFAGAFDTEVVGNWEVTEQNLYMYLYYQGGIIKLKHMDGSGGENYGGEYPEYMKTMDELEAAAFEGPEDALFVLYGENSIEMENYMFLPFYEISTSENSQKILITAVCDNSYFWYDEEGKDEVWSELLDAGESVILQIDVPKQAKAKLWVNINDEAAYSYDIDKNNVVADSSFFVVK